MAKPRVRIFVSSPGDVGQERLIVERVIAWLQGEFLTQLALEPVFWEHEPVRATADYQSQFPLASSCDVVVCILWSRLGTRLPAQFGTRPDGTPWASGTEFEFEDAARAHREHGLPDLLVFRKTAPAFADLSDDRRVDELRNQKRALDGFLHRWFGGPETGFTAGFTTFNDAADFEEKVTTHLRRLLERRLPASASSDDPTPSPWHKGSPFRGLEPFETAHAAIFFGRTRAVSALRDAFQQQAARGPGFLLLVGASGSGKSSLLRAGVVPTLTAPGVIEDVGLWRVAILRPGDSLRDPNESLAAALTSEDAAALPELVGLGYDQRALLRVMADAPQLLDQPIQSALRQAAQDAEKAAKWTRPPLPRLLLIVDQLEELFTIPSFRDEDRSRFIQCLSSLARSGSVWVACAVRSDFYHRCLELPDLSALKLSGVHYDLLPPTLDELRQMIVLPARAAGLRFEQPEEGERLDAVLQGAAARHPGALPLLEFALDELYRRAHDRGGDTLSLGDYHAMGGLEGALAQRADEVLARLPEEVSAAFNDVMALAVNLSPEQGHTAAPVNLDRLGENTPARRLIDAMVATRLMVSDSSPDGAPTARLAHDALLKHWQRLSRWVAENEDLLRTRARVEGAAARWREAGRRDDYLLNQGRPLAEAVEWLGRAPGARAPDLVEFVQRSRQHARRRKRARRLAVGLVTALFILVVGVSTWWIGRTEAEADYARKLLIDTGDSSESIVRQILPVAGVDPKASIANVTTLIQMFDRLVTATGPTPELLARKAGLLSAASRVYAELADSANAERLAQEAEGLYRRALEAEPSRRPWLLARGENLGQLALTQQTQGRIREAEARCRAMLQFAEDLRRRFPDDTGFLRLKYSAMRFLGNALYYQGDIYTARTLCMQAMKEFSEAVARPEGEGSRTFTEEQAKIQELHARLLLDLAGDSNGWESAQQTVAWYRQGLELATSLSKAKPGDGRLALLVASAQMGLAGSISDADPVQAEDLARQVLVSTVAHVTLNPLNLPWSKLKLHASLFLGDLGSSAESPADQRQRIEQAVAQLEAALKFAQDVTQRYPTNYEWWVVAQALRFHLAASMLQLAGTDQDGGQKRLEESRRLLDEAYRGRRKDLAAHLDHWLTLSNLRASMPLYAALLPVTGQSAEATKVVAESHAMALAYFAPRREAAPDNPGWADELAQSYLAHSRNVHQSQERTAAHQSAFEIYDRLTQAHPDEWQWASRAANVVYLQFGQVGGTPTDGLDPAAKEKHLARVAELQEDCLRRYEALIQVAPALPEHHERLAHLLENESSDARARYDEPAIRALASRKLDLLRQFYKTFPERKPDDLFKQTGHSSLRTPRFVGRLIAPDDLRGSRGGLSMFWSLTHFFDLQMPSIQFDRRLDAILDVFDLIPDLDRQNSLDREEAFGTLWMARAYLDELKESGHQHEVLDIWRAAIEKTLGALGPEPRPIPEELRRARDRMEYAAIVKGWLELGASPREVLGWLDAEVRLAKQATWRESALWTLLLLDEGTAARLLDLETLDRLAFAGDPQPLDPETITLLQAVAAVNGDAWSFLALAEGGQPSEDILAALRILVREPPSNPDEDPVQIIRSGLGLASPQVLRPDASARIEAVAMVSRIAADQMEDRMTGLVGNDLLGVGMSDRLITELGLSHPRVRALANLLDARRLIAWGQFAEARLLLDEVSRQQPDSRWGLQLLVWLDLEQGASGATTDLRRKLLRERFPRHPLTRLLIAWGDAQARHQTFLIASILPLCDDPAWCDRALTYDLLGRVAEAAGAPELAKEFVRTAIEKLPRDGDTQGYRTRLEERLP